MAVYGNVNVKYAPCKSVAQLHSAADYILGKKKEQLSSSVIKTKSELYNAFGCNRDNFANSVLMTRKMHQKKYSRFFPRDILAQKLSISFRISIGIGRAPLHQRLYIVVSSAINSEAVRVSSRYAENRLRTSWCCG